MENPDNSSLVIKRVTYALGAAAVGCVLLALRWAVRAPFATDEFTYAHGAWAIAQGQQPFRDFFFHHFPLLLQLGSAVFRFSDEPSAIGALRWLIAPFWIGTIALTAALNCRHSRWAALLSAPLLVSLGMWSTFGTQFRPDPLALAFFLASLTLVTHTGPRAKTSAFAAGVCYSLAAWGSQKVVIYGIALPLAWLVSVVRSRASVAPRMVQQPWWLAAGVTAGLLPIAAYLTWSDNWGPIFKWCWQWGLMHEKHYPARPLLSSFKSTLTLHWHVLALGVFGALAALAGLVRRGARAALADPDSLLVISASATAVSYTMQNAPYGWSLVAPLTFTALFAARALASAAKFVAERCAGSAAAAAALAVAIVIAYARVPWSPWPPAPNTLPRATQDTLLTNVAAMTEASDPVYDNTGYYVARPHADYFFFTDRTVRIVMPQMLVNDMPKAIVARGVTVNLADLRERELPGALQTFITAHFVSVAPRVRVWGKRLSGLALGQQVVFDAVRHDEYYVTPAKVVSSQELHVDGKPWPQPVMRLTAGKHVLTWNGPTKAKAFAVLWLPADGKQRKPVAEPR